MNTTRVIALSAPAATSPALRTWSCRAVHGGPVAERNAGVGLGEVLGIAVAPSADLAAGSEGRGVGVGDGRDEHADRSPAVANAPRTGPLVMITNREVVVEVTAGVRCWSEGVQAAGFPGGRRQCWTGVKETFNVRAHVGGGVPTRSQATGSMTV